MIQQIAMEMLITTEQVILPEPIEKGEERKSENTEPADSTWMDAWTQYELSSSTSSMVVGVSTSQYMILLYNSDGEVISEIVRNTIPTSITTDKHNITHTITHIWYNIPSSSGQYCPHSHTTSQNI